MKRLIARLMIVSLAAVLYVAAQPAETKAPITSNPIVELKGKIGKVQVARGQGMPYIEVESGGQHTKVTLGSMRYLMEQNFNPKAGAEVEIKGYRMADGVVASVITLPAENKTLRLRDESGRPLWMGGPRGKGYGKKNQE